ncbi:MAG: Spo0B domain-containing protein [Clostridia bacterium]|nr:Spo0B domain-containing protein [Clostridia bacterium]MBQ4157034.1 Spo0B domain-containing protein [Clostridia bacterium]
MAGFQSDKINMKKLAIMTILLNSCQMASACVIMLLVVLNPELLNVLPMRLALGALTLIVIWGASVDIREALHAKRITERADMMEDSIDNLETLNIEMRKQRHDFMNHLQVVYSLAEMKDTEETLKYIETVYGDLRRVGRLLKTSLPAVNALLAAKESDAEEEGIVMEMVVRSSLENLSIPAWEMCRVLGNIIDNSFDALKEVKEKPCVKVTLSEDAKGFFIEIQNNGPMISENIRKRIFEEKFSTKGEERGMGLAIVKEIVTNAGGNINVESGPKRTAFSVRLPRLAGSGEEM